MTKLLLLPSAKLVPPELRAEFGAIPSAMIPLDSRPALRYIADPYVQRGYDVLLAVHEAANLVGDYLNRQHTPGTSLVDVGVTSSLGETILNALDSLESVPSELIINFADTFVGDELAPGDTICYAELDDLYRWTGFSFDSERNIVGIADKVADASVDEPSPVFVGVFRITRVDQFRRILRESVSGDARSRETDPFFTAVAAYFRTLSPESRNIQRVRDWRDFGHLDTYYRAKRAFCLNQRFFNDVKVDAERGIVRKSSRNADKFIQEVKWYLALPRHLQYLGPRIFDYKLLGSEPFVEMEFYSYPALNDVYLFGNLDAGAWRQVLQALEHAIDQMQAHRYEPLDRRELNAAMRSMYLEKTISRLDSILSDPRFERFCRDEVTINGETCVGLTRCVDVLPEVAESMRLFDMPYFTVIHGDFCLSNILYDRRNGFVRLIDPRGEFGSVEVYGDFRYDLAKLCHSIEGDYDFFVNNLMSAGWEGSSFNCSAFTDSRHAVVKRLFRRWIQNRWADIYPELKLIESLLFLSMVPLHADRFHSQQAFLAKGLELFTQACEGVLFEHAVA